MSLDQSMLTNQYGTAAQQPNNTGLSSINSSSPGPLNITPVNTETFGAQKPTLAGLGYSQLGQNLLTKLRYTPDDPSIASGPKYKTFEDAQNYLNTQDWYKNIRSTYFDNPVIRDNKGAAPYWDKLYSNFNRNLAGLLYAGIPEEKLLKGIQKAPSISSSGFNPTSLTGPSIYLRTQGGEHGEGISLGGLGIKDVGGQSWWTDTGRDMLAGTLNNAIVPAAEFTASKLIGPEYKIVDKIASELGFDLSKRIEGWTTAEADKQGYVDTNSRIQNANISRGLRNPNSGGTSVNYQGKNYSQQQLVNFLIDAASNNKYNQLSNSFWSVYNQAFPGGSKPTQEQILAYTKKTRK